MIRRQSQTAEGTATWILIDQVEHARLAGDLAQHWQGHEFPPIDPADVVVPTVYHHDDGWTDFDRIPKVDPQTGRPVSFTEMEIETAHRIWRDSIHSVAEFGPLSQYLVASHFISLRQGGERGFMDASERFVAEYAELADQWLGLWQSENTAKNTPERARIALQYLQLFDAISLWFCCQDRREAQTYLAPNRKTVTFTPKDSESVAIDPWPFSSPQIAIGVTGRQVLAESYDAESLATAPMSLTRLSWVLVRSD